MKHPKVQIYQQNDERPDLSPPLKADWGWRLIAANGEEVASGEGHSSPRDAERAFRTVCTVVLEVIADTYQDGRRGLDIEVTS
jgi:hypothetical protein